VDEIVEVPVERIVEREIVVDREIITERLTLEESILEFERLQRVKVPANQE
jgi:hypothetical protein